MRRFISILLALVLCIGLTSVVFADSEFVDSEFTDSEFTDSEFVDSEQLLDNSDKDSNTSTRSYAELKFYDAVRIFDSISHSVSPSSGHKLRAIVYISYNDCDVYVNGSKKATVYVGSNNSVLIDGTSGGSYTVTFKTKGTESIISGYLVQTEY